MTNHFLTCRLQFILTCCAKVKLQQTWWLARKGVYHNQVLKIETDSSKKTSPVTAL